MASASSVEELDREKRHSGNFVLETLQIKTFQLTPACTRPSREVSNWFHLFYYGMDAHTNKAKH